MTDRLGTRVLLLAAGFMLLSIAINLALSWWQVHHAVALTVDRNVTAYNDLLLAATRVEHGAVTLHDPGGVLKGLPRYWQITAADGQSILSERMMQPVPVTDDAAHATVRRRFEINGLGVIAIQNTFTFPSGERVTYLVGIDESVAQDYAK